MSEAFIPSISVREMLETAPADLNFRLLAGEEGLGREITVPRIQKLGLALAGYAHYIHSGRPQIIGGSEVRYLEELDHDARTAAIRKLPMSEMSCVIITRGLPPPAEFIEEAKAAGLPVLSTALASSATILEISEFLQKRLAPGITMHGVMIDLFGLGVFLHGESGIGKSECALDLITRGHRLVSDDVVEFRRVGYSKLVGTSPLIVRNHMEIRGLGIINIKDLFGVSAIIAEKPLDLGVRLERWDAEKNYDRLGLDEQTIDVLDVQVPLIEMPVTSGRNVATLVEVAVRNHLLKLRGIHAAREFVMEHTRLVEGDS